MTHGRERDRHGREQAADRPDEHRRPQPKPGGQPAADEAADRNRPPDDETARCVDAPEQAFRRQRLRQADRADVVEDDAEADERERDDDERNRKRGRGERHQYEREAVENGREQNRAADAEPRSDLLREERSEKRTAVRQGKRQADREHRHVQSSHQVDDQDRERDVVEEVERGGRDRNPAPVPVAEEVLDAVDEFAPHRGGVGRAFRNDLLAANPEQERRRPQVADRVREDRVGRVEQTNEESAEARAADLRRRAADLELRVALHELVSRDERRQVRLVRDVEEDRQRSGDEADDVELRERDVTDEGGERNRPERRRASEIRENHDRPARQPVDPDAGREGEDQKRQEVDRRERRDLERRRVQDEHRHEWQRDLRHVRAELADGLSRPQLQEIAMSPQTALRPECGRSAHLRRRELGGRRRPGDRDVAADGLGADFDHRRVLVGCGFLRRVG